MASYSTRTVTTTRREWIVPAAEPWGATAADVGAATAAAREAYWKAHDIPTGGPIPEDALRFHVGDEEIVISFTVEETAPGS